MIFNSRKQAAEVTHKYVPRDEFSKYNPALKSNIPRWILQNPSTPWQKRLSLAQTELGKVSGFFSFILHAIKSAAGWKPPSQEIPLSQLEQFLVTLAENKILADDLEFGHFIQQTETNFFSEKNPLPPEKFQKLIDKINSDHELRSEVQSALLGESSPLLHLGGHWSITYGKTPLMEAIEESNPEAVQQLCEEGARPNMYHLTDSIGEAFKKESVVKDKLKLKILSIIEKLAKQGLDLSSSKKCVNGVWDIVLNNINPAAFENKEWQDQIWKIFLAAGDSKAELLESLISNSNVWKNLQEKAPEFVKKLLIEIPCHPLVHFKSCKKNLNEACAALNQPLALLESKIPGMSDKSYTYLQICCYITGEFAGYDCTRFLKLALGKLNSKEIHELLVLSKEYGFVFSFGILKQLLNMNEFSYLFKGENGINLVNEWIKNNNSDALYLWLKTYPCEQNVEIYKQNFDAWVDIAKANESLDVLELLKKTVIIFN